MSVDVQAPPGHLSEAAAEVWSAVLEGWDLETHQVALLKLACEALDRAEEARMFIARDGAIVMDRWQQYKAHPAIAVERDARVGAARLFRELALEVDVAAGARPPRVRDLRAVQ